MNRAEKCGICWGSHMCGLPPRHDGDHQCSPEDEDGGCESVPRSGRHYDSFQWKFYMVDLLRYHDGTFCDLCGPVDPDQYVNPLLDHAMKVHPDIWAEEFAEDYADYLGDGVWRDRS